MHLLALIFLFAMHLNAADAAPFVTVTSLRGYSEVAVGEGEWKFLPTGRSRDLAEGFRIRTQPPARAKLAFADGSVMWLLPGSTLTWPAPAPELRRFELLQGRLLAAVRKLLPGHRFEIGTPTAVAGVKGTLYGLESDVEGTSAQVLEGAVSLAGPKGEALVLAGQAGRVAPGMTAPQVRGLSADELKSLGEAWSWTGAVSPQGDPAPRNPRDLSPTAAAATARPIPAETPRSADEPQAEPEVEGEMMRVATPGR